MLRNYRPVSNLPVIFIYFLIQKSALTQLQEHLTNNGLLQTCQSAYRNEHSTETALFAVTDSLLSNTDNRLASIVAFLDLSAAFDTLDHQILLKRPSIVTQFMLKCISGSRPTCPTANSLSPLKASL